MSNPSSEKPEFVYNVAYVDEHFTRNGWKVIRRTLREQQAIDIRSRPDSETLPSDQHCTIHATFATEEQARKAAAAVNVAMKWTFRPSITRRRAL